MQQSSFSHARLTLEEDQVSLALRGRVYEGFENGKLVLPPN